MIMQINPFSFLNHVFLSCSRCLTIILNGLPVQFVQFSLLKPYECNLFYVPWMPFPSVWEGPNAEIFKELTDPQLFVFLCFRRLACTYIASTWLFYVHNFFWAHFFSSPIPMPVKNKVNELVNKLNGKNRGRIPFEKSIFETT